MKTMVRVIDNKVVLGSGSMNATIQPEIDGVEVLSENFAVVTFEAFKGALLEMATFLSQNPGTQDTYDVRTSTGHWKGEDYTGLYITLQGTTPLGDLSVSHCFWHNDSGSNQHLRKKVTDWKITFTPEELEKIWSAAFAAQINGLERATGFSWDNTPEAYGPNKKAVLGIEGPGYQSSGLYPYLWL